MRLPRSLPDVRGAGATYAKDEPTEERVRLSEDEDFDGFTRVVSDRTLAQRPLLDMGQSCRPRICQSLNTSSAV